MKGLAAAAILAASASMLAQVAGPAPYSAAEVSAGNKLYRAHCVSCHGAGGDQIAAVNLFQGRFISRDLSNDENFVTLIVNGTSNGMMPGIDLSKAEASTIVAYLRSASTGRPPVQPSEKNDVAASREKVAPLSENAVRGRTLFEKRDCLTCHRLGERGAFSGPDLSDIAFVRSPEELKRALLEPDAEVVPHNRTYRVVTADGVTVTGRLLNHDTFKVQLIDAEGRLLSFTKANLKTYGIVAKSPMPSYKDQLSAAELDDLIAYLATLKR